MEMKYSLENNWFVDNKLDQSVENQEFHYNDEN